MVLDSPPFFKEFGAVVRDVQPTYSGGAAVSATFVGANPRNNLRLEGTYAAVEEKVGSRWVVVRDDSDWDLVFNWRRTNEVLGRSEVEIVWETELGEEGSKVREEGGVYRIRYFGDSRAVTGDITAFEGVSGEFRLA